MEYSLDERRFARPSVAPQQRMVRWQPLQKLARIPIQLLNLPIHPNQVRKFHKVGVFDGNQTLTPPPKGDMSIEWFGRVFDGSCAGCQKSLHFVEQLFYAGNNYFPILCHKFFMFFSVTVSAQLSLLRISTSSTIGHISAGVKFTIKECVKISL